MRLKKNGARLVNFVIDFSNGEMSRREFDLDYSGYVVDYFPGFEEEHQILRLHSQGISQRSIAQSCGCYRNNGAPGSSNGFC